MKTVVAIALLLFVGIGVALGAGYVSPASSTNELKVCDCVKCFPDGNRVS